MSETGGAQTIPQETVAPGRELGRMPHKGDERAIRHAAMFRTAAKVADVLRPFRPKRAYPREAYNNDIEGNCTRASQAIAAVRLELLEQRRRISFDNAEITRAYREMTMRLYGGGDTGGYETDALSEWRRPELTFKDTKGRPHTIDAYTAVTAEDLHEVKSALTHSAGRILKVCANMPLGWRGKDVWEAPLRREDFTGPWMPGSWGGHSMTIAANDRGVIYDGDGVYIQTWDDAPRLVTWAAFAAYFDEAHVVVDSINSWKKRLGRAFDSVRLVREVNKVSSHQIEA